MNNNRINLGQNECRLGSFMTSMAKILFYLLLVCFLPLPTQTIAVDDSAKKKGLIEDYYGKLRGINTVSVDKRLKGYESLSIEKLDIDVLNREEKYLQSRLEECRENWRKTSTVTNFVNDIEQIDVLKGYAYLKTMWEISSEYKAKLADIRRREADAYKRSYPDEDILDEKTDPRWLGGSEWNKYRNEEQRVNEWFINANQEATEKARTQHDRHLKLIDGYRNEILRQCLFLSKAILRVNTLIEIKQGKISPETGQEMIEEDLEWELKVYCDPEEIFDDEVSLCNAKLVLETLYTKNINLSVDWMPEFADESKGTIKGQEVRKTITLPPEGARIEIRAEYVLADSPSDSIKLRQKDRNKKLVGTAFVTVKSRPRPEIGLKITASPRIIKQAETVTYTYEVTNKGNVSIDRITLSDHGCADTGNPNGDQGNDRMLDPGETWAYECKTSLATPGDITNTATVTGYTLSGIPVNASASAAVKVEPVTGDGCPLREVMVPYLLYMTETEALEALRQKNLEGKVSGQEYSSFYQAGQVMVQDPPDGACVTPKSVVSLVISLGPETAPESQVTPAGLSAGLDCGDAFELAPGDRAGRRCGIIVRGWRSNTEDRVQVKVMYDEKSRIDVFPGDTSVPPSHMYTAGVADTQDRYVFSQLFTASSNAPPGITLVTITVSQPGAGEVTLSLNVAVLEKGLIPSAGSGIRPPATVTRGSGGEYCLWRYKLFGDPPQCFHFVAAACGKYSESSGYELVGENMTFAEADARMGQLSQFFQDEYGCHVKTATTDDRDECPDDPDKTKPGVCGCGTPDTDTDKDGVPDCIDLCDGNDASGDTDQDGVCDDKDICPNDKYNDSDGDGVCDSEDVCFGDDDRVDTDGDSVPDCLDECEGNDASGDRDFDDVCDDRDKCPDDPEKIVPGICGCGTPDTDTDKDGVADCKDQCPGTKAGITVDSRGCEADTDGDGVVDSVDQCANTRIGVRVDRRGCEIDSDGDGVLDSDDQCPGTPKGARVDNRGCVETKPVTQRPRKPDDCDVYNPTDPACEFGAAAGVNGPTDDQLAQAMGHGEQFQIPPQEGGVSGQPGEVIPPEYTSPGEEAGEEEVAEETAGHVWPPERSARGGVESFVFGEPPAPRTGEGGPECQGPECGASAAPVAVGGNWTGSATFPDSKSPPPKLSFGVDSSGGVSGSLSGEGGSVSLKGTLNGNSISMSGSAGTGDERITVSLKGRLDGNSANGTATLGLAFSREELESSIARGVAGAIAGAFGGGGVPQEAPATGGKPMSFPGTWKATRRQ